MVAQCMNARHEIAAELFVMLISMQTVQALDLSANLITGPLTSGQNALVALRYLSFDDNKLSGTLPAGLAVMQLKHLSLSGNALSGPLPPGFSNLTALRLLDLGSNSLTGSFPSGMLLLPQMLTLVSMFGSVTPGILQTNQWVHSSADRWEQPPYRKPP